MNRLPFPLLIGAIATGFAAWFIKPRDRGAPHDDYFGALQQHLQQNLQQWHPLLVIDRDRLARNCARLVDSLPENMKLRIVAKSLPSLPLIREVMVLTGTHKLMTFHQPFMNALAAAEPGCDLLLGKPMPVNAAARFYQLLDRSAGFAPERQVQWLIDNKARLTQYLTLAQSINERMCISIEIDVGLRRGGLQSVDELDALLSLIRQHPDHLEFAGLMGYDAHISKMPAFVESTETCYRKSNRMYQAFVDRIKLRHSDLFHEQLVFNGSGSPTFRLHGHDDSPLSEVSVGSCLVKPADFDLPLLCDFEPAAFIATPVLKVLDGLSLPGPLPLGAIWQTWDPNRRRTLFVYGGKWMAKPVSPAGLSENALFGTSSNQMMLNGPPSQQLRIDDWIFLRPTQSEAVLLQFGDMLAFSVDRSAEWWAPLDVNYGRSSELSEGHTNLAIRNRVEQRCKGFALSTQLVLQ